MITLWPSPAKLNLFLYITNRRSDGYHNLQTLFQFLDYGDTIQIIPNKSGKITLLNSICGIENTKNIILRAAALLKREAQSNNLLPINVGANISIKKNIPIGSGMGGGSSNAATILVALNYIWKCYFSLEKLIKLGMQLGADVPIFIIGNASFAEGIGNKFKLTYPAEKWYLIIYPNIKINTVEIFNDPLLTRNIPVRDLSKLLKIPFINSCEEIVRKRYRKLDKLMSLMIKYTPMRLTGTGSCVFGEFDYYKDAYKILSFVPKWTKAFITKGINISPLRQLILSNLSS